MSLISSGSVIGQLASPNAAPYATVFQIANAYLRARGRLAAEKFFLQNAQAAYKLADRA